MSKLKNLAKFKKLYNINNIKKLIYLIFDIEIVFNYL